MGKLIPKLGAKAELKAPILTSIKSKLKWTFSFEYFKQTEFFGLGDMDTKWFVSLLEKLKDLSRENIETIQKDYTTKATYRYHPINWDATNIPIKRSEIDWVAKEIIENEVEIPFFQFQLSMSLGRVIGFWGDGASVFYIVLLDPMHNMQPSKKYDYKVDATSILLSEYESLIVELDNIKTLQCSEKNCKLRQEIVKIPSMLNRGNFVYGIIEDDYYQELVNNNQNISFSQIIELGVLSNYVTPKEE